MGGSSLFPRQASTIAGSVDAIFFFWLLVAGFFSALIAALVVGFIVRFRRRSDEERPPAILGSHALEVTWTLIPLAITMFAFFWGVEVFFSMARTPPGAMEIYVVGKRWMWKTQHLTGQREINELHVPVGVPVRLIMTSEDVIHSFFVPAFRMKKDVVPGRYATAWFQATKPGRYHLFCAEYCGTKHSAMIGTIVVMEPAAFQAWLGGGSTGSLADAGQKLFQELGCATCHRADSLARGPNLQDLFGSPVRLSDGQSVVADESYIRESIVVPSAKVVAGYQPIMPTYQGLVTEEGLMQLLSYIRTIGTSGARTPAEGAPLAALPPAIPSPIPKGSHP